MLFFSKSDLHFTKSGHHAYIIGGITWRSINFLSQILNNFVSINKVNVTSNCQFATLQSIYLIKSSMILCVAIVFLFFSKTKIAFQSKLTKHLDGLNNSIPILPCTDSAFYFTSVRKQASPYSVAQIKCKYTSVNIKSRLCYLRHFQEYKLNKKM